MQSYSKLLAVFVASASLMPAQAQPTQRDSRGGPPEVFSVRFEGGSLADYVKAVQDASAGANVLLVPGDASGFTLPPTRLDGVTVATALAVTEGEHVLDPSTLLKVMVEPFGDSEGVGRPVYRVSIHRHQVMVWNVVDLFSEQLKPADVLTAVENALDLLTENTQTAQVRFHETTGVLIASGSQRQVGTINNLLEQMRGHLVLSEIFGGIAPAPDEQGGEAVERVSHQLSQLTERIDKLERRITDVSKQ